MHSEKEKIIMKRLKIAQYIALVATALTFIGVYCGGISGSDTGTAIMGVALTVGMASYIFGGLMTACKMAGKIAKWGWFVVPFPYDIITFFCAFFVAITVFLFIPIIPIRKAYKESGQY